LSPAGLLDVQQSLRPVTLDDDDGTWPQLQSTVGFRVRRTRGSSQADKEWRTDFRWQFDEDSDDAHAVELRVEVWRGGATQQGDLAIARYAQELPDHCAAVATAVTATATRLMLDRDMAMLQMVAAHHDSGKARELWQRAMGAPCDGKVYAKTIGAANPRMLEIGGETYRHEFGSLRDVRSGGELDALNTDAHDLALHLIASHHGHGRPVVAAVDPDHPPSTCVGLAQDAALRFARLSRVWGTWELAWWEALFRAADWQASSLPPKKESA
jgi:CRISPR-associated endonuclease/helicase Cas3